MMFDVFLVEISPNDCGLGSVEFLLGQLEPLVGDEDWRLGLEPAHEVGHPVLDPGRGEQREVQLVGGGVPRRHRRPRHAPQLLSLAVRLRAPVDQQRAAVDAVGLLLAELPHGGGDLLQRLLGHLHHGARVQAEAGGHQGQHRGAQEPAQPRPQLLCTLLLDQPEGELEAGVQVRPEAAVTVLLLADDHLGGGGGLGGGLGDGVSAHDD